LDVPLGNVSPDCDACEDARSQPESLPPKGNNTCRQQSFDFAQQPFADPHGASQSGQGVERQCALNPLLALRALRRACKLAGDHAAGRHCKR
jgi:hypothetical protein